MNIIKVNYNNAYIKLPDVIFPFAVSYHENHKINLEIRDNLNSSDFYTNYKFDIYINNEFLQTIDIDSEKNIIIGDHDLYHEESFIIKIVGYYYNDSNKRQDVNVEYQLYNYYLCSEHTICSEKTICNEKTICDENTVCNETTL